MVIIDFLKTALQEPPACTEDFRENTRRHLAKLATAFDKARSKTGIREVAVKTVLGGSGNDVRRLQQSETAPVPWPAAAKFRGKNYFGVAQRSTAVNKARNREGIREVAVETVPSGSGNDVRRSQQSETAPVSWRAAAEFWAMTSFDVAQRSTAVNKARKKRGMREVAEKAALGGDGNDV